MVQSTTAIVIKTTRLTETSLIIHWLTPSHGLIKTVAKGARQPRSPFAGKIDLFFECNITFQTSTRSELNTLKELSLTHWRDGLRQSYTSTLLASYFCQLTEGAIEPHHPVPELFDLLQRALNHLDGNPPTLKALLYFESQLARYLGVANHTLPPHIALKQAVGTLPSLRPDLLQRLQHANDLHS
jgi:DNA repair protein RecO (recombination protein O)